MAEHSESVFVWRSKVVDEEIFDEDAKDYARYIDSSHTEVTTEPCGYCEGPVVCCTERGEIHESTATSLACTLCGWTWSREATYARETTSERLLREFSLDSAELSLEELGSYLRTHYPDINSISGRTFERLVADVFANQGFQVELTKASRDGGYDLLLLEGSGSPLIIEVKRWQRPVGVSLVRQLRGVQLSEGARKAMLVTSSRFTGPARREAHALRPEREGYCIDLLDADDVLRLLGTYTLPTFSLADLELRRISAWRCQLK